MAKETKKKTAKKKTTKKVKKEPQEEVVEETKTEEPKETVKEEGETRTFERRETPHFKTLKSFEQKYGTRNFLEIALKTTEDEANQFISISKGFYDRDGRKRYKRSLGFSVSDEMKKFVIDSLKKI